MAKIYSAPKEIKEPTFNFRDIEAWRKDEKRYIKELRAWCKKHGSGSYRGEIVRIPHADSYAEYMVFSLKPATLIHMPLGDAWDSPYAELMNAKSIKEHVDRDRKLLSALFK